jgi:hypothetical protein
VAGHVGLLAGSLGIVDHHLGLFDFCFQPTGENRLESSSELQPLGRFGARLIAEYARRLHKTQSYLQGVHQCAHFGTIPADNDRAIFQIHIL